MENLANLQLSDGLINQKHQSNYGKRMANVMREKVEHVSQNEGNIKLDLSDVSLMFDDYQRLQVSFVRHQMHLIVKGAALIPDEDIEEDAYLSRALKNIYE